MSKPENATEAGIVTELKWSRWYTQNSKRRTRKAYKKLLSKVRRKAEYDRE